MYEIKVKTTFSSAHKLKHYRGRCEKLHGHNWTVELELGGDRLDRAGLLCDFAKVKKVLKGVTDKLDHACLNDIPYFGRGNPTSENIAKYIYEKTAGKLERGGVEVTRVNVWESETSRASYTPFRGGPCARR